MESTIIKTTLKGWKGADYIISTSVNFEIYKGKIIASFYYQTQSFACQGNWSRTSKTFDQSDYSLDLLTDYVNNFIKKENRQ